MSVRLPDIIGIPFQINSSDYSGRKYQDSLPILNIQPMEPDFNKGVHFLRLIDASNTYRSILRKYGFTITKKSLKFVFTLEGSITDGASNSFGETHLAHLANAASEPLFEARQILGIKSAKDIQNKLEKIPMIGGTAAAGLGKVSDTMTSLLGNKATNLISSLALGSRIDMPQIWKSSSTSMDYSVTIKLYNPDPSSELSYEKYIIGPIISLYALTLPRTDSNDDTYRWPFYCRATAPGLFKINMGAIKDLSISKGGSATSFDYQQRPTTVEIRLTIGELFSTRVMTEDGSSSNLYPTLKDYLNCSLQKKSSLIKVYNETHYDNGSTIQNHDKSKLFIDRTDRNLKGLVSSDNKKFNPFSKKIQTLSRILNPKNSVQYQTEIAKRNKKGFSEEIQKSINRAVATNENKELTQSLMDEGVEWIDPDLSDNIEPLGENSFIDLDKNIAVVHQLDFKTIKATISKAKDLVNNGVSYVNALLTDPIQTGLTALSNASASTNQITNQISNQISPVIDLGDDISDLINSLPVNIQVSPLSQMISNKIPSNMKNVYDILTESADKLDDSIPIELTLGDNSIVNIKNKTAILDSIDFPNKNKLEKHTKDLEKSGFKVHVILT